MKRSFKHMHCLAGLAFGALAGCETNPITGRSQFMVVSEDMAIGQSAAAYSSMMGDLGKKRKVEAESPRAEKVRHITDRLIAQAVRFRPDSAKWKWRSEERRVGKECRSGWARAHEERRWRDE